MNATTIWIDDTEYKIDELIKIFGTDKLARIISGVRDFKATAPGALEFCLMWPDKKEYEIRKIMWMNY